VSRKRGAVLSRSACGCRDIVHGRRIGLFGAYSFRKSVNALGEIVRIEIARRSKILHESRYELRRRINVVRMRIFEKFLDATADMIEKSLLNFISHGITPMKFAYADPPYLGCGHHYIKYHPDAMDWDDPEEHRKLIDKLCANYPDGWAMSLSSSSLHTILPMCPSDVRICSWVKPFAVFKPHVGLAYAWEPVIIRGGRKRTREQDTIRDWLAENAKLKSELIGSKPRKFCRWIFSLLNAQVGDELYDLFAGSNAVSAAWSEWINEQSPLPKLPLEA
jgi:hypothetical protein